MTTNNPSTNIIKWFVIIGDFILLNIILFVVFKWIIQDDVWNEKNIDLFVLISNASLIISQIFYSTIIYQRLIGAGDVLRRVISLTILHAVLSYFILRVYDIGIPVGWMVFGIGTAFVILLLIKRLFERGFIRLYRESGRNTRTITFVGSDPELLNLYEKMKKDPTLGYNVLGYYADAELGAMTHAIEGKTGTKTQGSINDSGTQASTRWTELKEFQEPIKKLGTLQDFVNGLNHTDSLVLGDDLYVSISRRDRNIIQKISQMCDKKVIRFFYVPVSVESIGLNLKREMLDDVEVYTTYENPLQNPINRIIKRTFDIVFSLLFLIPTALLFPFIFIIMKIQSPGPILFKQKRTGLDGREFEMLKFRSMHVNADADKVQATKDDPRKYPFGNFMRKTNIDELPQFLNVLKGDMSIVGPRPHMLAHTEMYSSLIDKYMVRHFVKPGVTGWAQVTGFRGETKELWQMEGRVKRDIWYIEHWSFWLDVRIIWLTFRSFFVHDEHAY